MNREDVRRVEDAVERALADAVGRELKTLPPRILHLMAKAAVTVLEAALEAEKRASRPECPD